MDCSISGGRILGSDSGLGKGCRGFSLGLNRLPASESMKSDSTRRASDGNDGKKGNHDVDSSRSHAVRPRDVFADYRDFLRVRHLPI